MLFRFTYHHYAKGKPIFPRWWNTSYNSLPSPWKEPSKPSLRTPCAPWFATRGPGTFESYKTASHAASYFPTMACSNDHHWRTVHRWSWSQRLPIRRWKIKCVEKFSLPASALIGSSEAREEQRP